MRLLLLTALIVPACAPPEAAPEDVDALMSFAFRHYGLSDANEARSLADAASNLLRWFDGRSWIDPESADPQADYEAGFGATISTLSDEALGSLTPPSTTAQADRAVGVMVARWEPCTLEDLDRIYLDPDQFALFPDNYLGYARSRIEGVDCFSEGGCDRADWRASIDQKQLIYSYTMEMASGLRRVDAVPASDDGAPPLQARLSRSWMLDEPSLTPPGETRFVQNYQMEIMAAKDGGVIHFYGQWTHLEAPGINTDAAVFLNSYVDGVYEYLDTMRERCLEE